MVFVTHIIIIVFCEIILFIAEIARDDRAMKLKLNTPLPQPLHKECLKAAQIFDSFVDSNNNGLDGVYYFLSPSSGRSHPAAGCSPDMSSRMLSALPYTASSRLAFFSLRGQVVGL